MTYFNRKKLILNTLESLKKSSHDNFSVIVVDDGSDDSILLDGYPFETRVIRIEKKDKSWLTHTPAQNIGVQIALNIGAEILVLQNAEARHIGDVLKYAEENITQSNYLSFACYSLSKNNSELPELDDKIEGIINNNNIGAYDSEHDSWYNHPLYRGTGYDFCAAITRENIIKLNGYDERYKDGYCYSDDDFVMRIKRLGLEILIPINPFVVHQWHGSSGNVPNYSELVVKNRDLYGEIARTETGYKAKHLLTKNFDE